MLRHRSPRQSIWLMFSLAWVIVIVALIFAAVNIGRSTGTMQLLANAETDAGLKTALLNVALERPRVLPLVLSGDPDVRAALKGEGFAAQQLSEKLEALIPGTQASVIYVTRSDGRAIASSNWNRDDSFIGVDFAFREYYYTALAQGRSEHYALGHVSKQPGLYIANRVDDEDGTPLGIVVAKVEFPQLESDWRIDGKPVYVSDQNGVVLMTSIAEWRFNMSYPLSDAALNEINRSRQFLDVTLKPLPFELLSSPSENVSFVKLRKEIAQGTSSEQYLKLEQPVPTTQWTLNYLQPTKAILSQNIREMVLTVIAALMPLLAFSIFWLRRRHKLEDDRSASERDRAELEKRVGERTRELSSARDRLQVEMAQREETETALRQVQHKLVQANRLSILGQVAAGVAHEINQPVATIRTFADNSRKLLSRGRADDVETNLLQIASLTERIGKITSDLKILARKGRTPAEPVLLRNVIDGAVMLLQSRFSGRMNILQIDYENADIAVLGSQIRLEQILINLLQNALEAVEPRPDGAVHVSVSHDQTNVTVSVKDNGPGIAPEILQHLFSPFNTSKEGGLGLGLVISSDIAGDYGGRIDVDTGENGTCFSVHLKKADA
jgi:two-component system C4-dicarboxylate transport sensor histidine kinase DctB